MCLLWSVWECDSPQHSTTRHFPPPTQRGVPRLQSTNKAVMSASMPARWVFVRTLVVSALGQSHLSHAKPIMSPISWDNLADTAESDDLRAHQIVKLSYITETTSEASTWSSFNLQKFSLTSNDPVSRTVSRCEAYFLLLRPTTLLWYVLLFWR